MNPGEVWAHRRHPARVEVIGLAPSPVGVRPPVVRFRRLNGRDEGQVWGMQTRAFLNNYEKETDR